MKVGRKAAEKVGVKAILIQRTKPNARKTGNLRTVNSLEEIFNFID
jgi:hypothetical protein